MSNEVELLQELDSFDTKTMRGKVLLSDVGTQNVITDDISLNTLPCVSMIHQVLFFLKSQ